MVVVALAACGDGRVTAEHDSKLVRNRIWIDHIPTSQTDKVNAFAVLTKEARRPAIGAFHKASQWEGQFEAFLYELGGNELRAVFPQNGDRETIKLDARACSESRFDYCLDVEGSKRGVKRYYSKKGWEIRDTEQLDSLRLWERLR